QPLTDYLERLDQHGAERPDLAILSRLAARSSMTKSELRAFTQEDVSAEQFPTRLALLLSFGLIRESVLDGVPELRSYAITEVGRRVQALFDSIESRFTLDPIRTGVLSHLAGHRFLYVETLRSELEQASIPAADLATLESLLEEMKRTGLVERL